jgi:hypothetical protein
MVATGESWESYTDGALQIGGSGRGKTCVDSFSDSVVGVQWKMLQYKRS